MRAIQGVLAAKQIFVATNYEPPSSQLKKTDGSPPRATANIRERLGRHGVAYLRAAGVTALLRLPLDLPLLQPKMFDELLRIACTAPGMVIVPSRDGAGTNALLRTPPTLFPSHFGTGSFAKHTAEGQRAGAQVIVRRNRASKWM